MDWTAIITPLTGLPEDVLQTTLHYLYAECLPQGLSETTAQKCIKMVGKMPGFVKFGQLCETFLKNTALTQRKTLTKYFLFHDYYYYFFFAYMYMLNTHWRVWFILLTLSSANGSNSHSWVHVHQALFASCSTHLIINQYTHFCSFFCPWP